MIELVLNSGPAGSLHRLAVDVVATEAGVQRPLDIHRNPGPAEATLLSNDNLIGEPLNRRKLPGAVGSLSGPAWKTSRRRRIPTWVAASPTPEAAA